jgi:hypothetical protein
VIEKEMKIFYIQYINKRNKHSIMKKRNERLNTDMRKHGKNGREKYY